MKFSTRSENLAFEGGPLPVFCEKYSASTPEEAMINACNTKIHESNSKDGLYDLKNLVEVCNSRVIEKDIATHGRLEIEDDGYAIYVSNKIPESRKRFTIAHELAHILIIESLFHKPKLLRSLRLPAYWNKIEKLCNIAADEITVPPKDFIEQIKNFGLTSEGIQKICSRYKISRDHFFVKFTKVFKPSAIALCKSQSKKSGKFTPAIVSMRSSLSPVPLKEGPITMNNIMQNLIRAAVRNGQAWSNSLVGKVNGKNTTIFRLAVLSHNSIHNKKKNLSTLDGSDILERQYGNNDIILFYLPLEQISNADDLIVAIQ